MHINWQKWKAFHETEHVQREQRRKQRRMCIFVFSNRIRNVNATLSADKQTDRSKTKCVLANWHSISSHFKASSCCCCCDAMESNYTRPWRGRNWVFPSILSMATGEVCREQSDKWHLISWTLAVLLPVGDGVCRSLSKLQSDAKQDKGSATLRIRNARAFVQFQCEQNTHTPYWSACYFWPVIVVPNSIIRMCIRVCANVPVQNFHHMLLAYPSCPYYRSSLALFTYHKQAILCVHVRVRVSNQWKSAVTAAKNPERTCQSPIQRIRHIGGNRHADALSDDLPSRWRLRCHKVLFFRSRKVCAG